MFDKLNKAVRLIIASLRRRNALSDEEGKILELANTELLRKRLANRDDQDNADLQFLTGKISFLENLRRRAEIECHETQVNPKGSKKTLSALLREEYLAEGKDGVYVPEPFWHLPFRILRGRGLWGRFPRDTSVVRRAARLLESHSGEHAPLPTRQALANEVANFVGHEPGILFSRTPAIFNPFENIEPEPNYTEAFVQSLHGARQEVLYVWSKDAIINQIRQHLRSKDTDTEGLKKLYYDRFSKFAENPHLNVYWGDNSEYTNSSKSIPYLSQSRIVLGIRKQGKLHYGTVVDRGRYKELLQEMPKVGYLFRFFSRPEDRLVGAPSFEDLRKKLLIGEGFEHLDRNHPVDIVRFIDMWFEWATNQEIS